jgi:ethanolamine kinase
MVAVSNRLAQWHAQIDKTVIQHTMRELPQRSKQLLGSAPTPAADDLWTLLDKWIDSMPTNVLDATPQELRHELAWFRKTFGTNGPEVVAHCDLLSGNIIVPPNWNSNGSQKRHSVDISSDSSAPYTPSQLVTFIDYEYALPAPRGFDIANHFMEWQGLDCRTELIPEPRKSNPVLRFWVHHYLSSFNYYKKKTGPLRPSEQDVDKVIDELVSWWGMPGFYWGIWAAIQSTISEIDFDYASYARSRLAEYQAWKRDTFPSLL